MIALGQRTEELAERIPTDNKQSPERYASDSSPAWRGSGRACTSAARDWAAMGKTGNKSPCREHKNRSQKKMEGVYLRAATKKTLAIRCTRRQPVPISTSQAWSAQTQDAKFVEALIAVFTLDFVFVGLRRHSKVAGSWLQ